MMRKVYDLIVTGKNKTWGLTTEMDEESAADWQADGVDLCEATCAIPEWVNDLYLTRIWSWLQHHGFLPI